MSNMPVFSVRLPEDLWEELRRHAAAAGTDASSYVRSALRDRLERSHYTEEDVAKALDQAAALISQDQHIALSDEATDLVNLMVNATAAVLKRPDVTLDEVMDDAYDGGRTEVRSWWSWGG